MTYLSGFQIVHRYAYVVVPAEGDPVIVFPSEARYVGEHGTAQIEQVFHDRPGEHMAEHARGAGWKRVGVFGLDYVMAVRDEVALAAAELELVPFDVEFDLARAVKSDAELESVRDSVRINERGFEIFARELRAREERSGGHGGRGGVVHRRGLRAADHEHGAHRHRLVRAARVQDRPARGGATEVPPPVARGRGARDALGRDLARDRRRGCRALARHRADGGGVRRVRRGGEDGNETRARRVTTSTAPCRPGSSTAATTSATSPATRSG